MPKIETFVKRGKITESIHETKCLIKNYNLKTLFSTGNENDLVYPRSAIKIFQAIPFINSLAYKKYKLTQKQIAISCASHCGEKEHLNILEDWIRKIKINKNILQCGVHNPLDKDSSDTLLLSGIKPTQLHNNCAGKHLAMISGCLMHKQNINTYIKINHPYQKLIRETLEYFTDTNITKKQIGVDGCSAPQYSFPLNNVAISMINLLKNYREEKKYSIETKILLDSITKYPHLTGSKKIYPSQLMKATNGAMFSKGGAEGVLLFAHKEKKLGGVIKVKDGNERALPSVANEIFKKLKILNNKELSRLGAWTNQNIYNHAKVRVGNIYTNIK